MSGLIPIDELTELKPASEVAQIASEAEFIHEKESVAAAINNAANTGTRSIRWSKPLSDKMQEELEAQGYRVTQNDRAADPDTSWTISF